MNHVSARNAETADETIYSFNIPRWDDTAPSARDRNLKKKTREVYAKYTPRVSG